jgi:prevent-host-death family protein
MSHRVSASDAKNNFGGLLEQVAAHGRVDITKHGRVVAVVLSPRLFEQEPRVRDSRAAPVSEEHMIPPALARAARIVSTPDGFDDP